MMRYQQGQKALRSNEPDNTSNGRTLREEREGMVRSKNKHKDNEYCDIELATFTKT